MKYTLSIFIILFFIHPGLGQNLEKYKKLTNQGYYFYNKQKYEKALKKYEKAFNILGDKSATNDRYKLACLYALLNNVETSFYHLSFLANNKNIKYHDLPGILNDSSFNVLHSRDEWKDLTEKIEANKIDYEKNFDFQLIAMLDSVYEDDQKHRNKFYDLKKKHGLKSKAIDSLWQVINIKDSINQIKVTNILDHKGWLGPDVIGEKGSLTLFLVIQHAELVIQKKYLQLMKEAVKQDKAKAADLALLEDRIAIKEGKKQIYGSQLKADSLTGEIYVLPLIDPENVDKRRAEIGLETMNDYLKLWGVKWNLRKYLKRYESKEKE